MENFEKYASKLPVIPEVASRILSIGEDNQDFSFKKLEEIISLDPMLTSRILKVANSALYARQKEITTLQMAIGLLGFKNIKSLVLLISASQFSRQFESDPFYNDFWTHSIVTAFIAREIYYRNKDRVNQDLAFTLALLHDIGKVALFNFDPAAYRKVLEEAENGKESYPAIERKHMGTDHHEAGAQIMRIWNLPDIFAQSVELHGKNDIDSPDADLIRNISIADYIAGKLGFGTVEENIAGDWAFLLKGTDVGPDDLTFFLQEYEALMVEDPLFLECEKLFPGKKAV
ncbi:HDOD domain-containing protein [Spirochaeta isovalerica]|uniref:Putative nucleotidyltransferase with HDIG domain n=1 Tax=Spirochaeta isovalerica TaxID=150 RepID=A0A841RA07_9SPIO|nr:HDOD domain-containing protein [Spirochaeta isovalerica]MBB6480586.1 putative nucleotidyltransferase with HDIG domain [Spirochaeta isovalerica]